MMTIVQLLFAEFEQQHINYVHFKSNANLDESFAGVGDFDVLVDKNRITDVERVILHNNGRRHNPEYIGNYPGVDNWLLFDEQTGIIYHLHLHYQIATGKALVKDYVIPWSGYIFNTRVKDEKYNIFITNPNLELILLSVRCILKSRVKDWVTSKVGLYTMYPSLEAERQYLLRKTDISVITRFAADLFSCDVGEFVKVITQKTITGSDYRYLTRFVRMAMCNNRRMSGSVAQLKASYYRFCDLKNKFLSRKMGIKRITKKRCLSGGLIIAFVGVDGSGKSTLSNEINKWLSRKIECSRFYMGTGDGRTTLYATILKSIRSKVVKKGGSRSIKPAKRVEFSKSPFTYIKKLLMVTLISDVEKNNYKKIIKMHRYRLNGGISVLDRYPQIESAGQNDGPKIKGYENLLGSNLIIRYYETREKEYLNIVKEIKPDIIFRLNVSPEAALIRKNEVLDDANIKFITEKMDSLNRITFQGVPIIDVNTEKPYEEELLEIKRILWRYV